MSTVLIIASWLLSLYVYILLARVVIDLVQVFARDWRPRGFMLVVAEFVYTLTDPPLKFLRRFIPPLRLGQINLDIAFLVLIIGVQVLSGVLVYSANAIRLG